MFSQENKWVHYAYTGIAAMGVVANFKSYKYIKKTFNINDNLFDALSKDSYLAIVGNGLHCASGLIWCFNDQILKSRVGCVLSLAGGYIPLFTGKQFTVLITYQALFLRSGKKA